MQSAPERDALGALKDRLLVEAGEALRMAQGADLPQEHHHAAEAERCIELACVRPMMTLQPGERWP